MVGPVNERTAALMAAARGWWGRSLIGHSWSRVRELDLDTHALAFSAQQVLCTAPLIVAISSVLDRMTGRDASVVISRFFGLTGEADRAVADLFAHSSNRVSTAGLVFGLVVAVFFTTSVAAVQQRAFELIWTLPRVTTVRGYLRQLVWVPALAAFISVLLAAGRVGRAVDQGSPLGTGVLVAAQGVVVFGFYWWTQHWLLGGRVEWRALLPGAVAVGLFTTAAVRVARWLVDGQVQWQVEAYGLVGTVFVLSVWLGIFSGVIYAGILVGALYEQRRRDAASIADPPTTAQQEFDALPLTGPGLESALRDGPGDPLAATDAAARPAPGPDAPVRR